MRIALVYGMKMFAGRPLSQMLEIARIADELGFGYVCLAEHVVQHGAPDLAAHSYGQPRHTADESFPEPLTTLAAFAGVTRRIGLMTGILIAPLRPAPFLAKQAATVSVLSGGRLTMGVSTSWQREEYSAMGVPFEERGQRLTDTIGACRALWAGGAASFHSATVNFDDMWCSPHPEQADDVKVWFGGKFTPRLVRRVTHLGHGWIPFQGYNESLEEIGDHVTELKEAMQQAGRDPNGLDVAAWMRTDRPMPEVLARIPTMEQAGITVGEFVFSTYIQEPAEAGRFLEQMARELERYAPASSAR